MRNVALAAAAALALGAAPVLAETGVTPTEIRVGGFHDLSGIFAAFSVPAVKAAQHYFDEVNGKGGIHGRKIVYIIEDHGYQVPKAVQAANKLINRDEVFAMLLNLGTPHNLAAFPMMEPGGIPNFSPLTAARQIIEPPAPWKFAGTASYYDHTRAAVGYLIDREGRTGFCTMYLPTDFGTEIQAAVKDELAARNLPYVAETTHKSDEKDFTGALGKLNEAGCKTVAMALGVSQLITVAATAQKMGLNDMGFVVSSAGFIPVVAGALAKNGVTLAFYAGSGYPDVTQRMDVPEVKAWADAFTAATGEKAETAAMLGRTAAEAFVKALELAGPDLTRAGFIKAIESLEFDDRIAGTHVRYSATDHVGSDDIFVSKAANGIWAVVGTLKAPGS
jgi:branched-chain amino acid transport system substrate-binding protein